MAPTHSKLSVEKSFSGITVDFVESLSPNASAEDSRKKNSKNPKKNTSKKNKNEKIDDLINSLEKKSKFL